MAEGGAGARREETGEQLLLRVTHLRRIAVVAAQMKRRRHERRGNARPGNKWLDRRVNQINAVPQPLVSRPVAMCP